MRLPRSFIMWTPSTQSSRRTSSFSLRTGPSTRNSRRPSSFSDVALLAAAILLTSCAPVYGQYGNRSGNGSYGGYRVERQVFDSGYQDGYRQGRDDARDGDRFDPRGQREYRNADNGRYRSNDARNVYRRASSGATKRAIATGAAGAIRAGARPQKARKHQGHRRHRQNGFWGRRLPALTEPNK